MNPLTVSALRTIKNQYLEVNFAGRRSELVLQVSQPGLASLAWLASLAGFSQMSVFPPQVVLVKSVPSHLQHSLTKLSCFFKLFCEIKNAAELQTKESEDAEGLLVALSVRHVCFRCFSLISVLNADDL